MAKVYVFLADGCEEIEALTPVDLLRRAGHEVCTVSVMGRPQIRGSHNIEITADTEIEKLDGSCPEECREPVIWENAESCGSCCWKKIRRAAESPPFAPHRACWGVWDF